MMSRAVIITPMLFVLALITICIACDEAKQPSHFEIMVLEGTPYERGFKHGERFSNRIRSLYASLLPNSLLPYLNREQEDVSDVLLEYKVDENEDLDSYYEAWEKECLAGCTDRCREKCGFSYLLMKESGENLEKDIPQEYIDEMHGIADGSGMPYEEILILNTLFDTMLTFRAITFFIRQIQSPYIQEIEFVTDLEHDEIDNNENGDADEADEALLKPYEPSPVAIMREVPTDSSIRFVVADQKIGVNKNPLDIQGVDPDSIRIQVNDTVYESPNAAIITTVINDEGTVEILFTPDGGFPPAADISILLQVGDLSLGHVPPLHARFMRDEWFTFSTVGYGKSLADTPNRAEEDGRTQPPSISFAMRGSATVDGDPIAAHHYALLDSDTTHKHTVMFIHKPQNGIPHATFGYTGIVWGFSGMNTEGVTFSFNNSDSLDNSMAGEVSHDLFMAHLLASGVPIGIMGREILKTGNETSDGVDYLRTHKPAFGWNVLLADAAGDIRAVEMDSNEFNTDDGGVFVYDPEEPNQPSSFGPDDIRMASHYAVNTNDVPDGTNIIGFMLKPQRVWTSFYYRSLRAYHLLGELIGNNYGKLDVWKTAQILRTPQLVDEHDSMISTIFEPAKGKVHFAMGSVPATAMPFLEVDLKVALEKGVE